MTNPLMKITKEFTISEVDAAFEEASDEQREDYISFVRRKTIEDRQNDMELRGAIMCLNHFKRSNTGPKKPKEKKEFSIDDLEL